jgi:hypothetical protein
LSLRISFAGGRPNPLETIGLPGSDLVVRRPQNTLLGDVRTHITQSDICYHSKNGHFVTFHRSRRGAYRHVSQQLRHAAELPGQADACSTRYTGYH